MFDALLWLLTHPFEAIIVSFVAVVLVVMLLATFRASLYDSQRDRGCTCGRILGTRIEDASCPIHGRPAAK